MEAYIVYRLHCKPSMVIVFSENKIQAKNIVNTKFGYSDTEVYILDKKACYILDKIHER